MKFSSHYAPPILLPLLLGCAVCTQNWQKQKIFLQKFLAHFFHSSPDDCYWVCVVLDICSVSDEDNLSVSLLPLT